MAGALGTAVIGSLIASVYGARVSDSVAGLPDVAEDSIGQANAVAGELPASEAARVMDAAADAFTAAMGIGFVVAGACALRRDRRAAVASRPRPALSCPRRVRCRRSVPRSPTPYSRSA